MFYIGCHVSSAGGYTAAATHADALGGSTFALFTRNPRGGSVKPLDEADMAAFSAFCCAHEMGPMVAHAPYTLNPCGAKDNVRDFAFRAFSEDREYGSAHHEDQEQTHEKADVFLVFLIRDQIEDGGKKDVKYCEISDP